MAEWQYRPLDPVYPVLFIDCVNVKIRDGKVANRPIYMALAVTFNGRRDISGCGPASSVTGRAQSTGCRCCPRSRTAARPTCSWSSATALPGSPRRSRPCGRSDHPNVCDPPARELVSLRIQARLVGDRQGSQTGLHRAIGAGRPGGVPDLTENWEQRYPAIIKLWENAWPEVGPFLRFDTEIRTVVCTTNAIESINARIRRAVNARGHFPTEQAALKCVYLAIMSLDPKGTGQKRWSNRWKSALNAFEITFDGRLSAGRK